MGGSTTDDPVEVLLPEDKDFDHDRGQSRMPSPMENITWRVGGQQSKQREGQLKVMTMKKSMEIDHRGITPRRRPIADLSIPMDIRPVRSL